MFIQYIVTCHPLRTNHLNSFLILIYSNKREKSLLIEEKEKRVSVNVKIKDK